MVTPSNAVALIIIHPQISKRVTAEIILVSPASILVGEWLQRQRHFLAWSLYGRSKWDFRHSLHCFVLTDIYLYTFMKGKTYRVNSPIWVETAEMRKNGDNHIQNFKLGSYIVGYTFRNQNAPAYLSSVCRLYDHRMYADTFWNDIIIEPVHVISNNLTFWQV